MIDNNFEDSVDDTADEVIRMTMKMHEMKMRVLYTRVMLADS